MAQFPNTAMQQLFESRLRSSDVEGYFGSSSDALGHARGMAIFEYFKVVPVRTIQLICPTCNSILRSMTDCSRPLKWRYRCTNDHKFEPTTNTFLYHIRLKNVGADKLFHLMFRWLKGMDVTAAAIDIGIREATAVAHYGYFRDVANKIAWHDYRPIGGADDIVEVEELLLYKRSKKRKGEMKISKNVWLFGGISRKTGRLFIKLMERRSEKHLPIMQEYIDASSYICSNIEDGYYGCNQHFAGYATGNQTDPSWAPLGRFHEACLDREFKKAAPNDDLEPYRVHTQNVEDMWKKLKMLAKCCTSRQRLPKYLGEFMYRQNVLGNITGLNQQMVRFLTDLPRVYPGIGRKPMAEDRTICDCHECRPP